MIFKIIHSTTYTFDSEVFFEPHYFRFKPKTTSFINVKEFGLNIEPSPTGISQIIDAENNQISFAWFEGSHKKLKIQSKSVVEIKKYNPFNFLIYPGFYNTLPFEYSKTLFSLLQAALQHDTISKKLEDYGEQIKLESKSNTLEFITRLTNQIHKDFSVEYRHYGQPFKPDKTFKLKKGSCRDITWMQIQLMRSMGLATRFVSGYYYIPLEKANYELHAWLEVYLPGAGWLGFDPSNGITIENSHIPIITSVNFEESMPVTGTIRGKSSSTLSTDLVISIIDQ
jgi:transglutaminase-like putative cysteine protease